MANHINKMDELIGRSTLSATLPLLENIAEIHGLRLNRSIEFKKARILLASRYNVTRCK